MNRHTKVVRNVLALLVNQVGTWTVTLLTTLVVPPYLGVKLYGTYAFTFAYLGFFALLMNLGTSTYLTWRVAREPEQASRLVLNTLFIQVPIALIWGGIALGVLPLIDPDPLLFHLAMIIVASTILSALTTTCTGALAGLQIMRVPAFLALLNSALSAAGSLAAVILHKDILVMVATGLAAQVVYTIAITAYTNSHIRLRAHIEPRLWYTILAGGLPFFTWSAVLVFYGQIDVPMLKIMAGSDAVAWYSVALRIVSIPVFIPTILITAIMPALSKERSADSPHFRSLASRSIRLTAALNIPASVGTMLLASSVLRLLHYPTSFYPAIPLIAILAANMPLVAIDMILGTVLIGLGKQKAWTFVGVIAAVVNPLANLWAIPATQRAFGNGAVGASLTTMLTELVMLCGGLYLCPRLVFTRWDLFYVFRCLVAAAVMLPAVWALSHLTGLSVVAAVAYGAVVYAFAAYTLQVVRNEDLEELLGIVLSRAGFASPAAFWAAITAWSGRRRRGRQAIGQMAARARSVVSRPLIYTGTRVATVAQGAQVAKYSAPPVRFGPPVEAPRETANGGNGHAAIYPYHGGTPIGIAASTYDGSSFYQRQELNGYHELGVVKRPVRRLPPAPSARRLRRQTSALS